MRGRFLIIISMMLVFAASVAGAEPPAATAKPATPPPSSLTITSKAGLFRVEADHADVQTVIKQLFEKGDRQFNLENGISGIVTIRLIEQPLRVILDEICRQTFLLYHFDGKTGIYRFERNEQALHTAISRLQSLNTYARQQLDMLGIDLGPISQRSLSISPLGKSTNNRDSSSIGALGGRGNPALTDKPSAADSMVLRGSGVDLKKAQLNLNAANSPLRNDPKPKMSEAFFSLGNSGNLVHNDQYRIASAPAPRTAQQILAESRLVSFRIPNGHPLPVVDVLQQIGKQAQVTITIDTDVPSSLKLRIEGSVSSRPLPDLLNILTAYARLEWRWDGDHILITPRPDFRLFVGDGSKPSIDSAQGLKTKRK